MTVKELKPLVLDPDLDAWERQPGETARRFAQFGTYREDGRTRTLRKVAEALGLNPGYVRQVAAAGLWVPRAEAFDRWRDDLHQAQWLEQRRRAADNDAKLLDAALGKVAQRLQHLDPRELEPADLIRLLDVAVRHRRALFGDPQLTVAVTGPGGDPLTVQVAEFTAMGEEQRKLAMQELVVAVQRRMESAEGVEDDS